MSILLRTLHFSEYLYKQIYENDSYPVEYEKQICVNIFSEDRIIFVGLNSAWEIDHNNKTKSSINKDALVNAIDEIMADEYDEYLKIAVWHHPVSGKNSMDNEFLELLIRNGFKVCMHGHIHEEKNDYFKYDDKRGMSIIGAGTFGAPTKEMQPGIPYQYNLIEYFPSRSLLRVNTRKREKKDGAWCADSRWGDVEKPNSYYETKLDNMENN